MTESTRYLTATQAAARLGVKPATLYAYVSRGIVARHPSPDGRTSLFDPADVARLARRRGARRGTPSDVTVASELTLVDAAEGRMWFRGLDALELCTQRRFEEVASWLWTGAFDAASGWRADPRTVAAASGGRHLGAIASAVAAAHDERSAGIGTAAATDLMAALVRCLPGGDASGSVALKLATKLAPRRLSAERIAAIDAALGLAGEQGLTIPALIARMTINAGGGLADAVVAALPAAAAAIAPLASIEEALANDRDLDGDALRLCHTYAPFRTRDPRADVLLRLVPDAPRVPGAGHPSVWFAIAAVAHAAGMPPGAASTLVLVAQSAGWIAHAIEEHRNPTPYRPRLAYTGPPPSGSTPRRTLDAVRDYLARE